MDVMCPGLMPGWIIYDDRTVVYRDPIGREEVLYQTGPRRTV